MIDVNWKVMEGDRSVSVLLNLALRTPVQASAFLAQIELERYFLSFYFGVASLHLSPSSDMGLSLLSSPSLLALPPQLFLLLLSWYQSRARRWKWSVPMRCPVLN